MKNESISPVWLAVIANDLGVSVDYLRGRSDNKTGWKEFQQSEEERQSLMKELSLLRLIDRYITLIGYDLYSTDEETFIALTENIKQYINDQCEQVLKKSTRPAPKEHEPRRYQTNENK